MKAAAYLLAGGALWAEPCARAWVPPVQTVFVIVLENRGWSDIKGSADAPYLNTVLLPQAAFCEQYFNPPGLHPSLPNYLWLEAGTNFGILDDNDPAQDHLSSTDHLATLLSNAHISWKTYQEDIPGMTVPLTACAGYVPRHNPFVYFDDVTGTNDPACPYGIAHIRPYAELSADLTNGSIARYNFIAPNLCHDMHDSCAPSFNPVRQGDDWLASQVPGILASAAYRDGGALFILWDEGDVGDGPVGMLLLSPLGRGGGYSNCIHYTHSSLVRTLQEVFGVGPWLGDAANATDLSDLFAPFGFCRITRLPEGAIQLTARGVVPGKTNLLLASADLASWTVVSSNSVAASTFTFVDWSATNFSARFYRLVQE